MDSFPGERPKISNIGIRAGRTLSAAIVAFFFFLAVTNLLFPETFADSNRESGLPIESSIYVGSLAALCTLFYALPATSIVGAILITGFLGGAMAINLQAGETLVSWPMLMCIILGTMAWGGLYLRDPTLRLLLPIRLYKRLPRR